MESLTLHLRGPEGTRALGERIAALLRPGDFVGLSGELGAGKTSLVRAICEALGVAPDRIASPTFAIVHPYEGGRLPVWHADLYRLGGEDELFETGFFDLREGGGVLLVEWIERIPAAAPEEWLHVELRHVDEESREARLFGHGARGEAMLRALREGQAV